MAQRRLPEAERLHRHNEEMRYALAHNLTLSAARYALFEQRMGRRHPLADDDRGRRNQQLCGTSAEPDQAQQFWWNRD